jgi:hypothetical protein
MLQLIQLPVLTARLATDAPAFQNARPFRHLVFDDLLVLTAKEALVKAFPAPDWPGWDRGRGDSDPFQPKKLTCADLDTIPDPLDRLLYELNSGPFLGWLEKLTGIDALLPDLHLFGGGLHSSGPGGKLLPHIDFHFGQNRLLHRRLNLLVYLNPSWSPENNGALELWDQKKDKIEREVYPELGRTVIFQTDADSMHGFSKPLLGRFRNSVALYYYTATAPEGYSGDYATHWRQEANGDGGAAPKRRPLRRVWMFSARVCGGLAHRLIKLSHNLEAWAGRKAW